jgi:hypothetical protein
VIQRLLGGNSAVTAKKATSRPPFLFGLSC